MVSATVGVFSPSLVSSFFLFLPFLLFGITLQGRAYKQSDMWWPSSLLALPALDGRRMHCIQWIVADDKMDAMWDRSVAVDW